MVTKVEEVARAILAKVPAGYGMTEAEAAVYARAAILAMRAPTKAMKEAGEAEIPFHPESEGDEEVDVWKAMIDTALNEKES